MLMLVGEGGGDPAFSAPPDGVEQNARSGGPSGTNHPVANSAR
jgi:hypothetical protein